MVRLTKPLKTPPDAPIWVSVALLSQTFDETRKRKIDVSPIRWFEQTPQNTPKLYFQVLCVLLRSQTTSVMSEKL